MLIGTFISVMAENISYFLIFYLFSFAFRIIFMLSIGFDCKARKNQKRIMWMILSFISPLIAGIAYACLRNNAPVTLKKTCRSCNAAVNQEYAHCIYCGSSDFNNNEMEISNKNKKISKILFAVSIAAYIAALIICIATMSDIFTEFFNMLESANTIG